MATARVYSAQLQNETTQRRLGYPAKGLHCRRYSTATKEADQVVLHVRLLRILQAGNQYGKDTKSCLIQSSSAVQPACTLRQRCGNMKISL